MFAISSYDFFKTLHILGVVVLLGNVTITAFWKVLSDRTGDPRLIAHAQHGVTVSDWIFTVGGILLLVVGGYGATWVGNMPLFSTDWLVQGQALLVVSGLMWLFVIVPLQVRQGRAAKLFAGGGEIPRSYHRDSRLWLVWGIVATVPLVAAVFVMVTKA